MRKFAIKEENRKYDNCDFAILFYNEENDEYSIEIPKSMDFNLLPAIPGILARKGIFHIEDKWARRFVKERVIPPDRQNIGTIMKDVGMKYYSEFPLLVYTSGRCCMDDFYIEEIV